VIETIMILSSDDDGEPVGISALPKFNSPSNSDNNTQTLNETFMSLPLREAREKFERAYLLSQLERFDGNISQMAKFIEMERSALHRKLKSVGISDS
jgi:two-component system nitrogen regulation response regulator NtrX